MNMETFNPPGKGDELAVPRTSLYTQTIPLTSEEILAMGKYDMNEFQYPYKRVSGNYTHLIEMSNEKDISESMYDMISMFIMCGQRPHHIEGDITRNLHAFGIEGHFAKDIEILSNWCEALIGIDQNLEKHF
jgi:hypothetical protein